MTPNQLNRRIVADWLRGTSEGCGRRRVIRRLHPYRLWLARPLSGGCQIIVEWSHGRWKTVSCFDGKSRAEATAKASAWILRKGWEVSNA